MRLSAIALVAFGALLLVACSSAEPGSESVEGDGGTVAAAVDVPERYSLQQSFDFTITMTTTSIGGSNGRLDRVHTCERGRHVAAPQLGGRPWTAPRAWS